MGKTQEQSSANRGDTQLIAAVAVGVPGVVVKEARVAAPVAWPRQEEPRRRSPQRAAAAPQQSSRAQAPRAQAPLVQGPLARQPAQPSRRRSRLP
jgi:hypothetical protein